MLEIAGTYSMIGHSETFLEKVEATRTLIAERNDPCLRAAFLLAIGTEYAVTDPRAAIKRLDEALAKTTEAACDNEVLRAGILVILGLAQTQLEQYQNAIKTLEEGFAILEDEGLKFTKSLRALALISMALSHGMQGNYEDARKALRKADLILRKTRNLPSQAQYFLALARVSWKQEKYEEAASHFEKALSIIEQIRAALSVKENRLFFMRDNFVAYDQYIKVLQTLHEKYPSKDYDKKSLEIFERKQGRLFLEQMGKSGARNFAGLPDEVKKKEDKLEASLTILQSRLSKERSKHPEVRDADHIRELEKRIKQFKSDQTTLQKKIQANHRDYYAIKYPKPATLSELQTEVLEKKGGEMMLVYGVMEKESCLWVIGKDKFKLFPLYYGEKALGKKVREFREIGPGAVLEAISTLNNEERIPIRTFRRIVETSLNDLNKNGHELYEILIPEGARKMLSKADTLYVVPTGPLYGLPFEALRQQNVRYLVQDYSVAYLSSASLLKTLREARKGEKQKPPYPFLAFADPITEKIQFPGESPLKSDGGGKPSVTKGASRINENPTCVYLDLMGGSFPRLPDSAREAREIKKLFKAPDIPKPLHLRGDASRSKVFDLNRDGCLDDYRYILFSCHGILPNQVDRVTQPALVLSHPDPKTKKAGFLTMADVFSLKLNADLVTLSACNTGRGEVQKGEGVRGLTRAFMYAGTPAVAATLWSIVSSSTKALSIGLHKNLKAGKGRAEALREVKLRMIEGKGEVGWLYKHPFFWAPMVLFGEGR